MQLEREREGGSGGGDEEVKWKGRVEDDETDTRVPYVGGHFGLSDNKKRDGDDMITLLKNSSDTQPI